MKIRLLWIILACLVVMSIPAFAQDDTDGDGIPNSQDQCPEVKASGNIVQNSPYYGCADRDGDGVADVADQCPDVAGQASLQGCPSDRDKDNIPDDKDACPDTAARGAIPQDNKYYGCVDIDFDGIADEEDVCPNQTGTAQFLGCTTAPTQIDKDQDGVLDANDVCPTFPGEASNDGCSLGYDRDGDGVNDGADRCKSEKGKAEFQGCPTAATATPTATSSTSTTSPTATPTAGGANTGRATLPTNPVGCVVMPNVANRAVNVRQTPDEASTVVATLPDTQVYTATAQAIDSQGRTWYLITGGAWVASWVLDITGTCASLPQQNTTTNNAAPTASTVLQAPQVESVGGSGSAGGLPTTRTALNSTNSTQVRLLVEQTYPTTAQISLHGSTILVDNAASVLQRFDLTSATLTPQQEITLEGTPNLLALGAAQYVTSAFTAEGNLLSVQDLAGQNPPLAWRLDSNQAVFSPDGRLLIAYFYNGTMASTGTSVINFLSVDRSVNDRAVEYNGMVTHAAFRADGTQLAFHSIDASGQNFITIIDPANPTSPLHTLPTNANNTNEFGSGGIAFSPDGTKLALGTIDGGVQIWETTNWTLTNTFTALPNTNIRTVAFDNSGTIIAAAGGIPPTQPNTPPQNTVIALLDANTGTPLTSLAGHTSFVMALHFTPDGALLVSASDNGEIKIWGIGAP